MIAAVLIALIGLLAPTPPALELCSEIHVIGVRGSGQDPGLGRQVGAVVEQLEEALPSTGRRVTVEALDYPAVSISDSFGLALLNGEYAASVRSGAVSLSSRIRTIARSCPSSGIVLVGYSQGAQVMKAALGDSTPDQRIVGLVLLADPTRDPEQVGIVRLGDPTGIEAGAFGSVGLPNHLRTVAIDVCAPGDGVCERGRRSLTAHTDGYDDAPPSVVAELLRRIVRTPLPAGRPL